MKFLGQNRRAKHFLLMLLALGVMWLVNQWSGGSLRGAENLQAPASVHARAEQPQAVVTQREQIQATVDVSSIQAAAQGTPTPTDEQTPEEIEEQGSVDRFLLTEEIIIGLMLLAVGVAFITQRYQIPYTVGLVVAGVLVSIVFKQQAASFQLPDTLTSEVILALLVPPLVFEAAFHLDYNDLRRDLRLILGLAVPGVLITMFLVGSLLYTLTDLKFEQALLFGAIVSATDPVAVVALFRSVGTPKRLQVILEGESLFNDGTAIVLYALMLPLVKNGTDFQLGTLLETMPQFALSVGGGLFVGIALGYLASNAINRIDNYLLETTLTTVLAYGAYLLAEELRVSGVLAVVVAGLLTGNADPKGMSPTTRIVIFNFWEYIAFLANSFVFLLIGLQVDFALFVGHWQQVLWAIGAVLLARAVSVFGLGYLAKLSLRWQSVLWWGGLRGAISLALALSLPILGDQGEISKLLISMTFGVVLFTLLVKGLSMRSLVQRLVPVNRNENQLEYERRQARAVAARAAYRHLQQMHRDGLVSGQVWEQIAEHLESRWRELTNQAQQILKNNPALEGEALNDAWRESLRAQRIALRSLHNSGQLEKQTYDELSFEIDAALGEPYPQIWGQDQNAQRPQPINRLTAAILQQDDTEQAIYNLRKLGFVVAILPSSGGFFQQKNTTLLIGFTAGREQQLVGTLRANSQHRIAYVVPPIEGIAPAGVPIEIPVFGATLFTFEVEHFEIL